MSKSQKFKQKEFISIVGFYANTALVDKKLMAKIKNMDLEILFSEGFFGPMVRHALYQSLIKQNDEEEKKACQFFDVDNFDTLLRRFGVTGDVLKKNTNNIKYSIKFF